MTDKIYRIAAVLCGLMMCAANTDAQTLEAPLPDGVDQVVIRDGEVEWGPCPPGPLAGEGCGMAVLEGNPKGEQIFTFRIRVTVIDGSLYVGFGEKVDKASSTRFEAGDFYVNRAGAAHFVWSDEPMTVQLTGIGPWEIHPLHEAEAAKD
jgi:hypothetical protein